MAKPIPEHYATRAEYRWALKLWRRRTGGSLLGTIAICLFFGALSGSTVGLFALVAFGIGCHLYIRHTRG
jgi:hypothetical protein